MVLTKKKLWRDSSQQHQFQLNKMKLLATTILLCATPVAHSLNNTITIQETFDDACSSLTAHKDTLNWEVPVWQWGGAINGGVSGQNVGCRQDSEHGAVLQLFSHGDKYV